MMCVFMAYRGGSWWFMVVHGSWFIIWMSFIQNAPTTPQTEHKPRRSSVSRMIDNVGVVIISLCPWVHLKIISLRTAPRGSLVSRPTESTLKRAWKPRMKNEKLEICELAKALSRLEVMGVFGSKVYSPQDGNVGAALDKQHDVLL